MSDMTLDTAGNIFFADYYNNRIREINTSGIISTVAGNGTGGYTLDGVSATSSEINHPFSVFVDNLENIYIGDQGNIRIRKVDISGIISTIVGTGVAGFSGDGVNATSAQLNNPDGLAVDDTGNVYIADLANQRIRVVSHSPGNIINTFAGTGVAGYSGDGMPATSEELNTPDDVAVDGLGNIFITDLTNYRIRKVSTTGIMTTIAGTGSSGSTGDGSPATAATFEHAGFIAIDRIGNVYIADANSNRIRKINTSGIIFTIAGTGTGGFMGDNGPATSAELNGPSGVAVDNLGNIFFSDINNQRIRKISYGNHLPSFISGHTQSKTACKNTSAVSIDTLLAINDIDTGQTETWTLSSGPSHGTAVVSYTAVSTGSTVYPSGLSYTPTSGYTGNDTFTVRIDDGYSVYNTTIYVTVTNCAALLFKNTTPVGNEVIKVYPNPNNGSFIITPFISGDDVHLIITNLVGEIIEEISIDDQKIIKLNIPPGIYFLAATTVAASQILKVVVE